MMDSAMGSGKRKTRKLDWDNEGDLRVITDELKLIDPSGRLLTVLVQFMEVQELLLLLKGRRDNPSANEIAPNYVKFVKMQRDACVKMAGDLERFIQILEEGI